MTRHGVTWGWVEMLDIVIRMAAWGVCLGGLILVVLLIIAAGLGRVAAWVADEPEDEEPWLPEDRRRWRP